MRESHEHVDMPAHEVLLDYAKHQSEQTNTRRNNYGVGAALLVEVSSNGTSRYLIYTGRNIDLSGSKSKIHAEEVVLDNYLLDCQEELFKERSSIEELVVVTTDDDCPPPCGHCRQKYAGIVNDLDIIAGNYEPLNDSSNEQGWNKQYYSLKELLPKSYTTPAKNGM